MAYVNGNLALKPKQKPQERHVYRESKRKVIKRKSLPVGEKLLYLFTVIVCVAIASVIIFRYAQIYDMNLQNKRVSTEAQTLNTEIADLKRQVEMLSDPERIRKLAEEQGMVSMLEGGITIKRDVNLSKTATQDRK
ncbi:cell division protein FtsL [Paenibacillus sp. J5C_2022]|uniref:cell division protein FtsL n=1 Tax=Paenibacillus sp. J5C2022 TaxID=2977129 RepID=UPI0021D3D701|nr:cell division protein FtsL [Paenibacillus sp. J5C2022]MCU6709476.1 cell division protein FtsL [Paenibacillus sp. J5C2022]